MYFKINNNKEEDTSRLSVRPTDQVKKWSITQKLKCQILETFEKTKRGQIPSGFEYRNLFPEQVKTASKADFISWYNELYRLTMNNSNFKVLSYIITKIVASPDKIVPTVCIFTSIIPHLATKCDNIYTCI